MKKDRVLLKELFSWVRIEDVGGSSGKSGAVRKTSFKAGDKVTLKKTTKTYATGERIPSGYKGKKYTVQQVGKVRLLLKKLYS